MDGDGDAFLLSGIWEVTLKAWWTCLGSILVSGSAFHFISAIVLRNAEFHLRQAGPAAGSMKIYMGLFAHLAIDCCKAVCSNRIFGKRARTSTP